jgi:hypothetical protein
LIGRNGETRTIALPAVGLEFSAPLFPSGGCRALLRVCRGFGISRITFGEPNGLPLQIELARAWRSCQVCIEFDTVPVDLDLCSLAIRRRGSEIIEPAFDLRKFCRTVRGARRSADMERCGLRVATGQDSVSPAAIGVDRGPTVEIV